MSSGLRLLSDDGFALALDAGGTMLHIQKVDDFTPHPCGIWQPPTGARIAWFKDPDGNACRCRS